MRIICVIISEVNGDFYDAHFHILLADIGGAPGYTIFGNLCSEISSSSILHDFLGFSPFSVADPGFGQGGPMNFSEILPK